MGIRSFLLQGGEDHYYTDMIMCNLLRNLQKQFPDCALGLSIGERSRQSYHRLHQAGDLHRIGEMDIFREFLQQGDDIRMGPLVRSPAATQTTAAFGWSSRSSFRVVEDREAWWGTFRMSQGVAVCVSHMWA